VKTKEIKFLNLLRALINCDGDAMVGNQSEISRIVLSKNNKWILNPPTKFNGKEIFIRYANEFIPLQNFKSRCYELVMIWYFYQLGKIRIKLWILCLIDLILFWSLSGQKLPCYHPTSRRISVRNVLLYPN
jgi:hypothetical protein